MFGIQVNYTPKENSLDKIRIFGNIFVKNNKNKCIIIYRGKKYKLKEYFEYIEKNYNYKEDISIILRIINNITDYSYMFYKCNSLISFSTSPPEISDIKKESIEPKAFQSLQDEFKNLQKKESKPSLLSSRKKKVFSNFIYGKDYSLSFLINPNVTNMNHMFCECISLKSLPDISNWNISNVIDISHIFSGCKSITTFPDISKWITSKVKNMSYIFSECNSLKSLPNISKWDTSNVTDMSHMFYKCKSLLSIPNFSFKI